MKKIFVVLAVLLSIQAANAQQAKSIADAKAAVEAALANTENPKKAEKPDTWIKLGAAYMEAYYSAQLFGIIGTPKETVDVVMAKTKSKGTSSVTLMGKKYTKKVYSTANYYFNSNNILEIIEVTKPIYGDVLDKARSAYEKAGEVDVKNKKAKEIKTAIEKIAEKYLDDAYTAYQVGKFAAASKAFEGAAKTAASKVVGKIDTSSIYNAGYTALMAKNNDRAKKFLEKAISYGYYGSQGEAFAKMADIAKESGDSLGYKAYLEKGFEKFPESQAILVGLINYYLESGENPDKLFSLLESAKKNEPGNASLYYVEGNIRSKLGQHDLAVAAYRKCSEVNPKYEFGYVGEGLYFYNKAMEISEAASKEMDDNKYQVLVKEFETAIKSCIEPFESAFAVTKDKELKSSIASYLKSACYRFCDDATYKAKYDKYKAAAESAQ